MKDKLLERIGQIDTIKSYFKTSTDNARGFSTSSRIIHNSPEFAEWSQALQFELQEIYDRTHDQFIWDTIIIIKQKFSGWNDEKYFSKLSGMLHAIQENIDKYYPNETSETSNTMGVCSMDVKTPKIFISHSSKDEKIVSAFVDLLFDIGLNTGHIFCTSVPGCGVLVDNDIYASLKREFEEHQVHVIFMLSGNYYSSPACLNEMGAAWILQTTYTSILLPGFEFREIDGAVNPRQMAIKLDESADHLKEKLGQLKNNFIEKFGLSPLPDTRWESRRDAFIASVTSSINVTPKIDISDKAIQLLNAVCNSSDGEIMKSTDLSGTWISAGKTQFVRSQERKEVAEWEAALKELRTLGLVESAGSKGVIFVVTKAGYDFIEEYTDKSST